MAHVFSLNRSNGGVPKLPVREALITGEGLEGDWQSNRKYHGGPDRALCLYSLEAIVRLQEEGHPIYPGSAGENVTIAGLDFWESLQPGTRLRLGGVLVEITSYTVPCRNIRGSFADEKFSRISQKNHPGMSRLYARVLEEGSLRVGDPVGLAEPVDDIS